MSRTLYIVVDKDGEFIRRRGKPLAFLTQKGAETRCRWEGDSVVAYTFDPDKHEPVFIATKTLKSGV